MDEAVVQRAEKYYRLLLRLEELMSRKSLFHLFQVEPPKKINETLIQSAVHPTSYKEACLRRSRKSKYQRLQLF